MKLVELLDNIPRLAILNFLNKVDQYIDQYMYSHVQDV